MTAVLQNTSLEKEERFASLNERKDSPVGKRIYFKTRIF